MTPTRKVRPQGPDRAPYGAAPRLRAEPTDFADTSRKVNLSSRYYIGHVDLLKVAATKLGCTVASLQRRASLELAAKVAGVPTPEFASLEVERDVVAEAAAREGLTKQEYAMRAAEREARRLLAKRGR